MQQMQTDAIDSYLQEQSSELPDTDRLGDTMQASWFNGNSG